ncbi:MAG: T9SS type A sorting domain-containing protein, partial [Flavobacteriales bacterium]|nr:T9SS type A sorting domain-containing protein [Flavobacteriales bacterium]
DNATNIGNYNAGDCPANATTGTTLGATASGGGCGATANDVWYYFTSGSSLAAQVELSAISAGGLGIEVFEDACGGTSVYCSSGLSHGVAVTPGHTYWMRVYSTTPGEFTVCVSNVTQPTNDECAGSGSLAVYAVGDCPTFATAGTTLGASSSGGSCGTGSNDVWYYFSNGSAAGTYLNLIPGSAAGMGVELYPDPQLDCSGSSVYCANGNSHLLPTQIGPYYRVRVFASTPGDFTICLTTPPTNDECAAATNLGSYAYGECPVNNYPGTTLGATASGGACGASDADVWYSFYSYAHVFNYVHLANDGAAGLGIEVFDACGGNSVYCASGNEHLVPVTPNTTMYMRVFSGTPGGFEVCVNRPPDNDECGAAASLNYFANNDCSETSVAGTTVGATFNGGSCGSGAVDVWYSLYGAWGNGAVINLTSTGATGLGLEAFDACGGNSLYCGTGSHHVVTGPNTWTYLRVFSTGPGGFNICTTAPATNNECSNAAPLTLELEGDCPANAVTGSTVEAGLNGVVACSSGATGDVWYQVYSGSATAMHIDLASLGAGGLGLEVFDACGGNSVYCANGLVHEFLVIPGTSYYLKVHSTTSGAFTICATQADGAEDCLGVPGGPAIPGSGCDDLSALTINDQYQISCDCQGYDCVGVLGGTAGPGTPCSYPYAPPGITGVWNATCGCDYTNCAGEANAWSNYPGTSCDDGDPLTINETWDANCDCTSGTDCAGVVGGTNVPGAPCSYPYAPPGITGVWNSSCGCDYTNCAGDVNVYANYPGTPCDDQDPLTINETWQSDCSCGEGTDCTGAVGGTNIPGTPCSYPYAPPGITGTWNNSCGCDYINCAGEENVYANYPGTPCDDQDPLTINETWQSDCSCGQGTDCVGVVGGSNFPGNPCTYPYAASGNTGVWSASCGCEWTDCQGVLYGSAYLDNCATCVGGTTGLEPCNADCNGVFGGTAYLDNCGTCVGGNTGLNPCVQDCNGVYGGSAYLDNCNTCVGGTTGLSPCVQDCNGVFGGTAYLDNCGTCVGGNTGINPCTADCNGVFGGTAYLDNCGTCVGGNTGVSPCTADCNGVFGGTAYLDNCGTCVGGNTGVSPCTADCNGFFGGTAYLDNCGTCVGGNTGLNPCVQDCNGVYGGTAYLDNCNTCVGGTTGLSPCVQDCNGVYGGTAYLDNCGTCVGGNTGVSPCTADCNGVFGGTAYLDNCGTCVGGNTGINPCTADCNGVFGGTAYLDNCGTCVGGNTGVSPCTADCNGVFGGTAYLDNCGTCVGGNTGVSPCTADCNGVFGGTAYLDNCGTCVGGNTGVSPCTADCNGVFGGTAYLDNCGTCVGGNTGVSPCTADCNGVFGGTAYLDNCGTCVGGNTGLDPCADAPVNDLCTNALALSLHEAGECPASAVIGTIEGATASEATGCGGLPYNDVWYTVNAGGAELIEVYLSGENAPGFRLEVLDACGGNNVACLNSFPSTFEATPGTVYWLRVMNISSEGTFNICVSSVVVDCAGVAGGTAYLDNCNTCVGGTTGLSPCVQDCNGVYGGTAYLDNCNTCVGGTTGLSPCVQDCNGVYGGTAYLDNCGTCVGGSTGLNPCVQDCNNQWGGTAYMDGCGTCVGGSTGLTACPCLNLAFQTDGVSTTTWELRAQGTDALAASGGGLFPGPGSALNSACVQNGCYYLRVFDDAGDGMINGGYILSTQTVPEQRIIDNRNNFDAGFVSAVSGNQVFCLPLGTDRLIATSCDKSNWTNTQYVVAAANPAVSSTWVVGGANGVQPSNSGYEFWIFDPNGSYSYRRFRSHNVSDGYSPASATRACHMKINNWTSTATTPHIPANRLLNVRVRGRIAGGNLEFGPACRFRLAPDLAACPLIKLQDNPAQATYSCGVTRTWGGPNQLANRLTATPPQFVPAVSSTLVRYQFRFRNADENVCIVRPPQTTYIIHLNWPASSGPALQCGAQYQVDVRTSKDGGLTWCVDQPIPSCSPATDWGTVCSVWISSCGGSALAPQPQATSAQELSSEPRITMYPNPNRGDQLFFVWEAIGNWVDQVQVDLFDMQGKRVSQRALPVVEGASSAVLDLQGSLSTGIYIVQIRMGDRVHTERLIIEP